MEPDQQDDIKEEPSEEQRRAGDMESEIYTGGPLPELPKFERTQKKTWTELRQVVRDFRCQLHHTECKNPSNVVFAVKEGGVRIYFLASVATGREMTLHFIDVTENGELSNCQTLLESNFVFVQQYSKSSRAEQLQWERKRLVMWGITNFDYVEDGYFVFSSSGSVFRCSDRLPLGSGERGVLPEELRSQAEAIRLDPQMCPTNPDIIAYVTNGDIWVYNCQNQNEMRLTMVHMFDAPVSAGAPCYVTQEEFNRYSGFWWAPQTTCEGETTVYSILFEVVDESEVEVIQLPGINGNAEPYRFPRAGTPNAKSSLRIASFSINSKGYFVKHRYQSLTNHYICGAEYLLRAGWTPDARHVWAQLLNRQQDTLQLILMHVSEPPLICDIQMETDFNDDEMITSSVLLLEERTHIWINVHDVLHFLDSESDKVMDFIWANESAGFRHLYLYQINKCTGECTKCVPLTSGNWEVSDKDVWVDTDRRLVYFLGTKDSPLEKHLYVVSIDSPGEVRCLTAPGASYQVFMCLRSGYVVAIESSLAQPAFARLYRISHAASQNGSRECSTGDFTIGQNLLPSCQQIGNLMEQANPGERHQIPELFSHQLSSGDTVYGVIFKPRSLDESNPHKFPTVLNIYGGPEVQMVTNSFKGLRHLRQHLLSSEDFCVIQMDCRGSRNRGVVFESHIKHRMGQVEIQDQVEVLQWLAEDRGYIDMSRVAIHGWSYGGYLSLMGLAQRPDIFKLAVAGAPVTQWNLYDTGYTERYMGLPESNREGYHRGSVLSYVGQFPDEEGRLLIIHGLMDENVHFPHTTSLIQALVNSGKPYRLQVYPQERHSLRHLPTSEHYDTSLLSFLQNNL
ncbi:dipeptidyl peptidase 9 [Galendromus occidentalis]|uniref:Dipeptidyl peptidase 9 n=1 Tax=Galendromus occidentalis TaxID=34638 RepID=A0AAJ6VVT8_9ACAR|nr:dipeptidyl peptidase 9 [Galendromus occidentalis]